METTLAPAIVSPATGRTVRAFGEEVNFLLEGEQTGGTLTMWLETTPPGGGPPPHYHLNEDECFQVLEGQVQFLVEGRWREVEPGGVVFIPRGSVHTFKNVGTTDLRMMVSTSPSGFEVFFTRCAREFEEAESGGPDMGRIIEISAEHGIHFVKS